MNRPHARPAAPRTAFMFYLFCLFCLGCSARNPIAAAQLLNHGNCKITQAGISVVSYEDVARLRSSKLLNMTTAQVNQGPELILLAVSKGRQSTPGYRFELADAFVDENTATIELRWVEPIDGVAQPQMITYPCIVVGLERDGLNQVRAMDDQGNLLGELSI
jgi:hypothetical protein